MKLKLRVNIGIRDAQRLELSKHQDGDIVSVKEEVGKELVARGWAEAIGTQHEVHEEAAPAPPVIDEEKAKKVEKKST